MTRKVKCPICAKEREIVNNKQFSFECCGKRHVIDDKTLIEMKSRRVDDNIPFENSEVKQNLRVEREGGLREFKQDDTQQSPIIESKPSNSIKQEISQPRASNSEIEEEIDFEVKKPKVKREWTKEDYLYECGQCGAYFDELKDGCYCPNCEVLLKNE